MKGYLFILEKAQTYLSNLLLSSDFVDPTAMDGWESLLRRTAAEWGDPEVGSVTGDYFLLETMASGDVVAWCLKGLTL